MSCLVICIGLDAYAFSDIERAINYNIAIASYLPNDHPYKFSLNTPKEVFRTMREIWVHCAPTPERICEDINGFDHVLDKIIESKGTIVKGEALRHGREMNHKSDNQ